MSDDTKTELGRRAMACKAWRLLDGMATVDGYRIFEAYSGGFADAVHKESGDLAYNEVDRFVPDMFDDATQGCALALLRQALSHSDTRDVSIERVAEGYRLEVRAWDAEGNRWLLVACDAPSPTYPEAIVAGLGYVELSTPAWVSAATETKP